MFKGLKQRFGKSKVKATGSAKEDPQASAGTQASTPFEDAFVESKASTAKAQTQPVQEEGAKKPSPLSERLKKLTIKESSATKSRTAKKAQRKILGPDSSAFQSQGMGAAPKAYDGQAFNDAADWSGASSAKPTGHVPARIGDDVFQPVAVPSEHQETERSSEVDPIAQARKQWVNVKGESKPGASQDTSSAFDPPMSSADHSQVYGSETKSREEPKVDSSLPIAPTEIYVSPIEEARKRWQAASSDVPQSFNIRTQETFAPVQSSASIKVSPTSPRIQSILSRRLSSDLEDLQQFDQKLYQVIHEFEASAEDELSVFPGDIVEFCGEEDGWFLVRVLNEDGTLEEGLIPASYCQEWDEEDGDAPQTFQADSPLSEPVFESKPIEIPLTFAYLQETVNAEFNGNHLSKFGIKGTLQISKAKDAKLEEEKLWKIAIFDTAEGKVSDTFKHTKFYVSNKMKKKIALKAEASAKLIRCNVEPSDFKEDESIPLLSYTVGNALAPVPLVPQLSWCRRSVSLFEKKMEVLICLHLTVSPTLLCPLENLTITLHGLPPMKKSESGDPLVLRCSPKCEWCPKKDALRWNIGRLSRSTLLKVILEEEENSDAFLNLSASVHFRSPGSLSRFALGGSGVYKTTFETGSYTCTSDYEAPQLEGLFVKE